MNLKIPGGESGHFQNGTLAFVVFGFAVSMLGCAPAPSVTTVQPELHTLGRIGITSPSLQPDSRIAGLPPRGTAAGALAGTAAGSFLGAFECLIYLYPLVPAYPICVAVFATAGTGGGMALAEPRVVVDTAQEKFSRILTERDWQALLRQRIVYLAAEEYQINAVNLGAPHLTAGGFLSPDTAPAAGQAQPDETTHATVVEPSVISAPADTLMEVALVKLATWFSGDHKFGFVLTGQAQLIRSSDLIVLTSSTHYYVSPSLPLQEWVDRDGALIGETVMAGVDYLAQEMAREYLHTP